VCRVCGLCVGGGSVYVVCVSVGKDAYVGCLVCVLWGRECGVCVYVVFV
jgi:hypothetical protein